MVAESIDQKPNVRSNRDSVRPVLHGGRWHPCRRRAHCHCANTGCRIALTAAAEKAGDDRAGKGENPTGKATLWWQTVTLTRQGDGDWVLPARLPCRRRRTASQRADLASDAAFSQPELGAPQPDSLRGKIRVARREGYRLERHSGW